MIHNPPPPPEDVYELGEPTGWRVIRDIFAEMMNGVTPWFYVIGGAVILVLVLAPAVKL